MSIIKVLRDTLKNTQVEVDVTLTGALADAERLADEFSEVRPQRYIVPIEKFVGLPILGEESLQGSTRFKR